MRHSTYIHATEICRLLKWDGERAKMGWQKNENGMEKEQKWMETELKWDGERAKMGWKKNENGMEKEQKWMETELKSIAC